MQVAGGRKHCNNKWALIILKETLVQRFNWLVHEMTCRYRMRLNYSLLGMVDFHLFGFGFSSSNSVQVGGFMFSINSIPQVF